MDGYMININNIFLDIIEKEKMIPALQISIIKIKLIELAIEKDLIKLVIQAGVINNEKAINILYVHHLFPLFLPQEPYITICDYSKIDLYTKYGYFIYKSYNLNKIIVINDLTYLKQLVISHQDCIIKLITKQDFYQILEKNFSHLNIIKAKYSLEFSANIVAKNINYTKSIIIFLIIYLITLLYFKYIFHITNIVCYFSQNILKLILFKQSLLFPDQYPPYLDSSIFKDTKELPIYTILLPLYKESAKLKSIIRCINNINYPKHKLDIKIIIEDDDYTMINESILDNLPFYIHLIKVPFSLPRTKPKVLNYAMQYCKGKYVVIYDAEDKPDPDQLLKAVIAFAQLPEEYACLQAILNFYNENENLLTKLFSIEYCLWFEYLLKGLSLMKLPITLGGTSNHFRMNILRKVGFWDAYNVTEDADLGIRLSAYNYKIHMLDSYTLEESPIDITNWINQRARWIKGFLQTFLVFLNQKDKYKKFDLYQIITIYIFIGFSSYGFYSLPFLIITIRINKLNIINYLWLINIFFALSYLYCTAFCILLNKRHKMSNFQKLDILALLFWPFYFLLHTLASYKAIWEIIFTPFKWNKTKHGISSKDKIN
jgi:cellulose synthase/poly-beta-1,6-N-acetylglucosamine synthase-like glycosyltransferase